MSNLNLPSEAIVAVTLNCNARCVMCNIWQNKIPNEVPPEFYTRLPSSLKDINITGGEPFLRADLPEVVKFMHQTCPQARLLINTNGYLVRRIQDLVPQILKVAPNIALRVSLDGFAHTHDNIRRLPNFFKNALQSLETCRKLGLKDLGVSYTLMEQNKHDLLKMYTYCSENKLDFSLTVATDSPIYFGTGKVSLRPAYNSDLKQLFSILVQSQYKSNNPKNWVRAWFNKRLLDFIENNTRSFACQAGKDFFYLDSLGRVYACHIKPWLLGDLRTKSFDRIFNSTLAQNFRIKANECNDCWMVCSARSSIKQKFTKVLADIFHEKLLGNSFN